MHAHEYQAKALLRHYDIPFPPYAVASSDKELIEALDAMNLSEAVLKIQVHAGGRGKGGGVKIAHSREAILREGASLLGMHFINTQTGPEGVIAEKILISPLVSYERESYLAIAIDRERGCPIVIASPAGGMEIEEIAHKDPDKVLMMPLPGGQLRSYHLRRLVKMMGWQGPAIHHGEALAQNLLRAFLESDALLLEINPLVEMTGGELLALDAKWSIDGDALFRHPDYEGLFDPSQLSPAEVLARTYGLAYVSLPGNIGCMVNGAGLAMATMDIIQYYGGFPANFLDVGGGASSDKIAAGFRLLLGDAKVHAILVNIFGGIMNCATLAKGIREAAQGGIVDKPVIVRMEGTNVAEGRAILAEANFDIALATDLADAAAKAVAAAKG